MKVVEAFNKGTPSLSFEFFPPKTTEQEAKLFEAIDRLKKFDPNFVSVTYGAMGRTREKTFFWVGEIKNKHGVEPVAHLTCVAATKDDIARQLNELAKIGVENILALRGDPPAGEKDFVPPANGFRLAKELIAFIKQTKPGFCVGAAGFPETHPAAPSVYKDTEFLKEKVEAGAEYIITQLFFDNRRYFEFVGRCEKAGITVPIIPGLMPITNLHQIKKMTETCGATLPGELLEKLEKHPADTAKIGAEHTLAQAKGLLKSGVKGLHFFVMNQAEPISQILSELKK
ncbi:MAG: methylenetetrahydrofolate reductase [NAD(P)H] [Candidatus Margulisbacteria bacterium]|nr:methylenetetrahydrofolate reductase [NAD(P)H] [Candidatus Margulisiibacteriota bacterium]